MSSRCGIVGVAGRPNVGKSTLVNAICGAHVSIVSDKPQTTRRRIVGVADGDDWQLVLLDLPGLQRPRDGLTTRMKRTLDESLADVDAVLLVLDASAALGGGDRAAAAAAYAAAAPVVIALNKVDLLDPGASGGRSRARRRSATSTPSTRSRRCGTRASTPSATSSPRSRPRARPSTRAAPAPATRCGCGSPSSCGSGRWPARARRCRTRSPSSSTSSSRLAASRRPDRVLAARDSESQKGILVGKGGAMVRAIGSDARPEIEELLGGPVMLDLRVRVRRGWRDDEALLDRLGP